MLAETQTVGAATATLERALDRVVAWVESHEFRAYEPADGNASPLCALTRGQVTAMRILQQVVLRSPVNVRPILGIRPHESAIGRGYMAAGYIAMSRRRPSRSTATAARSCLDWLMRNRAPRYSEYCWGDPYEYATRSGRRPKNEPILIWSALIGQAFLDGYEHFEDDAYLRVAESVGSWILSLPVEKTDTGSCLSYVPYRQNSIHNSNAAGAAFLARLGARTGNSAFLEAARGAMAYTCYRQRADGSWYYGEEAKYQWIDNFHTGYILSALHGYLRSTGSSEFVEHYRSGASFFRAAFFDPEGRPRYYHDRTYPVDIQCAAQSIETLAILSAHDPTAAADAVRVACWTIAAMQAADGHFCYRLLPRWRITTPMLHWGQGTMVKALATLLERVAVND
jgi:hypothetical protein